jgi:hypothetical protein
MDARDEGPEMAHRGFSHGDRNSSAAPNCVVADAAAFEPVSVCQIP